ncbi:MAG: hypothetical protein V1835_05615 [Candidatus Micrarchaeota archaeon]
MPQIYISTGRKPSQLTRKFGRLLSLILNAKYENRGKKSVDEICARAEKFGCIRIAFIYEKKGNPALIQFYDEGKGWMDGELMVLGVNLPERSGRIPKNLKIIAEDAEGGKIAALFGIEMEVEDETSKLGGKFSESRIDFLVAGKIVLEMKCKLIENREKRPGDE